MAPRPGRPTGASSHDTRKTAPELRRGGPRCRRGGTGTRDSQGGAEQLEIARLMQSHQHGFLGHGQGTSTERKRVTALPLEQLSLNRVSS